MLSTSPSVPALLTVEQFARLIHKAVDSVYTDLSRKPHLMPPTVKLPGQRRIFFRETDVVMWINRHTAAAPQPAPAAAIPAAVPELAKPKRGRPTKAARANTNAAEREQLEARGQHRLVK